MRSSWYKRLAGVGGILLLLLAVGTPGWAQTSIQPVLADSADAASVPSNATPERNEVISVAINADVGGLQAPDNRLAAYQTTLKWDTSVIQFLSVTPAASPWDTPNLNLNEVATGKIEWNDFVPAGSTGKINLLNLNFKAVGAIGSSTILDLNFTEITTTTFKSLLRVLRVADGTVTIIGNLPPTLNNVAAQTMDEGATLDVPLTAQDPENGKITFTVMNLPAFGNLIVNTNNTATLHFTPGFNDAGVYPNIQVTATDNGIPVMSDTKSFTLTVNNVNRPPILAAIANQTMNEGATLTVAIAATDADNDKIGFSAINLPAFASLTDNGNNTGTIQFAPGFEAAGVYPAISVIATDTGTPAKSDTVSFTLTVNNINRPPALGSLADQAMNEGATLDVPLTAQDPENGKITFTVVNLPPFGSLIVNPNNTATLHFTPGFSDAGVYADIKVTATDDGVPAMSDTKSFTLTVKNVNRPPVLTAIANQTMDEGATLTVAISATDPDNDKIDFSTINLPAFATLSDNGNGSGVLTFTPGRNDGGDYAGIVVSATDHGVPSLSDSTRFNLKVNNTQANLECKIEIVKPTAGTICADSVEVCVSTTITGAVGAVTKTITVNGFSLLTSCVKIPIVSGPNTLVAKLTVNDVSESCSSSDTVVVVSGLVPINCALNITAPLDNSVTCGTSVEVKGTTNITGGVPPLTITCEVNGVPAMVSGNSFAVPVKLVDGWNTLIATCTVTDNCNQTVVCRDTIRVQSALDDIPPSCVFTPGYKSVTGIFTDRESGIAKIEPLFLYNAKLTVDPFTPGAKHVSFRLDDLGEDSYLGFDIKVTDMCGNSHICDPVSLQLDANQSYTIKFRSIDRYFHLTNRGLTEVRVELNGKKFDLLSERSGGIVQSLNLYAMPRAGELTIDLQPYLRQEGDNDIRLNVVGPAGSSADLLLIDDIHEAEEMLALKELPVAYELSQNYPNPFNPETMIRFSIPAHLTAGAPVQLRIYNTLGALVRTLVEQTVLPGQYSARWDARDDRGARVAAGVYIYRLVAGDYTTTKRMLLLK